MTDQECIERSREAALEQLFGVLLSELISGRPEPELLERFANGLKTLNRATALAKLALAAGGKKPS